MSITLTFADKHTLVGDTVEQVIERYATLNCWLTDPWPGTILDKGKRLLAQRAYSWNYTRVDVALPNDEFLRAVAESGMVDLDYGKSGLVSTSSLQRDRARHLLRLLRRIQSAKTQTRT